MSSGTVFPFVWFSHFKWSTLQTHVPFLSQGPTTRNSNEAVCRLFSRDIADLICRARVSDLFVNSGLLVSMELWMNPWETILYWYLQGESSNSRVS